MLNLFSFRFCKNKKKIENKKVNILFYKEQFKYLKTTHSYHLVDPSPWRFVVKCVMLFLTQKIYLTQKLFSLEKFFVKYFLFLC